jgi:hypothetical protein
LPAKGLEMRVPVTGALGIAGTESVFYVNLSNGQLQRWDWWYRSESGPKVREMIGESQTCSFLLFFS